tara:strand:- start:3386 stop:3880 length:495 start_codon:yes stop_codon:yes gene_type:complete
MQVIGIVSKILLEGTYKQVFNLACQGQSVRVENGINLRVLTGDTIAVSGKFVIVPKYGKQFQANHISYVPITTPLLRHFLKTGTGIGDAIVDRLLSAYGFALIDLLENKNIAAIKSVERISEAVAIQLCKTWHAAKGKIDLIKMLENKLTNESKKLAFLSLTLQ